MGPGEGSLLRQERKKGVAMNDPTSILGQVRRQGEGARKGGVAAATARRGACVLALILLFLTVGGVPGRETGAQGFALQATSKPARADTLAGANQDLVDDDAYYEGQLSTRTRHKTH
jgi:hypothetical protein